MIASLARAILEADPGGLRILYGVATDTNTVTVGASTVPVVLPALNTVQDGDYVAILAVGADRLILGPVGGVTTLRGSYTYDGASATGYGPAIAFGATFTDVPIVTHNVFQSTASSAAGYYVKTTELSTTAMRFRHYATGGYWNDDVSGVVQWTATGVLA